MRIQTTRNRLEFLTIAVLSILFYLQLVRSGIATHDELQNIYFARTDQFFSVLMWGRWGMTLVNFLPSYLHALCTTQWTYRIYTMAGLLASAAAFFVFIKKCVGEKTGWLMLMLFFMFAQIELDHDGLLAFSFSYQLNICYLLISLNIYMNYLRDRKKKLLVLSAVFYLIAGMAYEAFILFGVMFFLIDCFYWIDRKALKIKNLFQDLILHASLVAAYAISYFVIRAVTGSDAGDAAIGTGISLWEAVVVTIKLALGLFPLNYMQYSPQAFIRKSLEISVENFVEWIVIILFLIVLYKIVKESEPISRRQYIRISILSVAGMLLPGVLLAYTNKFVDWIYYGGIKSFGTSYYSYFFIVAWLAATFVFIYQRIRFKKAGLISGLIIIAAVTRFTQMDNAVFINYLNNQQNKYDLYCALVETEYFSNIESGAQLYAPEYIGIHYNMATLSVYANRVAGTNITATNNRETLDFISPVYYLQFDDESDAVYLSKIDENGKTNEIFVKTAGSLEKCGFIAGRDDELLPSVLRINGKTQNVYGEDIISGNVFVSGDSALVQCDGIVAETFEIYHGAGEYGNGLLSTSGIWGQENWGRWAEQECSIFYNNQGPSETIELRLLIATPAEDGAAVMVACGDYQETLITNGQTAANLSIPITAGENEIRLSSSAPDITAEGDPRNMNIQIFDMALIYDGIEIRINNPQ